MTTTTLQLAFINASNNDNLTASQIVSTSPASNSGLVVSGPNFSGYTLTLQSGFAAALHTALGSPQTNGVAYPVTFSCGDGNSYSVTVADSNLITTSSTTITYNYGYISGTWQPTVMFILTDWQNKIFTLYG